MTVIKKGIYVQNNCYYIDINGQYLIKIKLNMTI